MVVKNTNVIKSSKKINCLSCLICKDEVFSISVPTSAIYLINLTFGATNKRGNYLNIKTLPHSENDVV